MFEWWGIQRGKDLKKLKNKTKQFVEELEITLKNFDQNGDVKELNSKLKQAINQFQKNSELS